MRLLRLPALLVVLAGAAVAQPVTVRGVVLSHDGQPLPAAHAHLGASPTSYETTATVAADAEGRFELTADTTGFVHLQLTGADHRILRVPLYVEEPGAEVELTAWLAANPPAEGYDELKVVGSFNNFGFGSALPMEAQGDGTYALTVPAEADTLGYQLVGSTGHGNSVNGTVYDRLVYDGGGDYRAVFDPVEGDSVTVVFDPAAAVRAETEPTVTFADPTSQTAQAAEALMAADALSARASDAMGGVLRQAQEDGRLASPEGQQEAFEEARAALAAAGLGEDHTVLRDAALAETDPALRRVRLAAYLSVSGVEPADSTADSTLAVAALEALPPDSPLWRPNLPTTAAARTQRADDFRGHLDRVVAEHPDPEVGASILFQRLFRAASKEDSTAQTAAYAALSSRFPETQYARMAAAQFAPDRAVMEGKPVPTFALASLNDPEVMVSDESLRGKTVLLDFWATWCAPCIAELPMLTELHEQYRDRGFTIVSLSFDDEPEEVAAFREDRFAMPWEHVFIEGGFESELAKEFGVVGIPKPILIGPDGTILATEMELRGEELRATLAEHLGPTEADEDAEPTDGAPE